ncbi:hypothetical protein V2J09_021989 [Rumex salicifolius]
MIFNETQKDEQIKGGGGVGSDNLGLVGGGGLTMVSLRRRRLLGLCSGLPDSSIVPSPMYFDDDGVAQFGTSPVNTPPISKKQNKEIANSSSMLGLSSVMQQSNTKNGHASTSSQQPHDHISSDQEVKITRQHKRNHKHKHEQERRALRGVYFKNMKWQAAIKVDKKQIHLGTVGSQAEATRLYDRAAFMCGRDPNFELPEEDRRELKQLEWDDFLEKTRLQISSKKTRRRRSGAEPRDKTEHSVQEGGLVAASAEVTELEEAFS